uniref:3-beta hydroxysteroid dehydrogenase/isomerase domain-containing protein n=1 Tax=Cyanoderma ruficeps TaxID=181631 RepID=A0A8C3QV75_9PASS
TPCWSSSTAGGGAWHGRVYAGEGGARLDTPTMHLGTPKTHLGTPKTHLGTPKIHLGTPKTHLGTPKMHLGTPKIHLGTPEIHLGTPKFHPKSPISPKSLQGTWRGCTSWRPQIRPKIIEFHPNFTQISPDFHPNFTEFFPKIPDFFPNLRRERGVDARPGCPKSILKSLNFTPISPKFHLIFTQISPIFTQISPNFFPKSLIFSPNPPGNVAWMHVLAARAARSRPESVGGQFYFCTDGSPCAPYEDFNLLLLGPAGLRFGGPRIPKTLLDLLAQLNGALRKVLGLFGVFWAPLLNPYTWAVASTPFSVRSAKAQRGFGYRPLFSWEEARDRTVAWVRQLDGKKGEKMVKTDEKTANKR